jgi:hypothetical protein
VLEYAHASGARIRYALPQRGLVTMLEAAKALGIPIVRLYRMRTRKELRVQVRRGQRMVSVLELRRVRRLMG